MSIKDRLQIILITYNRARHVVKTFEQMFYEGSPILNIDFLIIDNNSSDNTAEVIKEWQKKYSNIRYIKNRYNLGLSGNIVKAMETADKEYLWTISDDDKIDLSNWTELEKAINNNEELIFVARYVLPEAHKDEPAWWIQQATFIPGFIIKTSLFDNDTIKNAFDNIYTLFPHLPPILKFINDGKKPYILSKYLVDAGALHNLCAKDLTYTRGSDLNNTYLRTKCMSWIVGFANIISLIKDEKLKYTILRNSIKCIHGNNEKFIRDILCYKSKELSFMLLDVYLQLDKDLQARLNQFIDWNELLKKEFSYPKYLFYKVMGEITCGKTRKRWRALKNHEKSKRK